MEPATEAFILMLTKAQPAIYASILTVLPDRIAAQDILQETNLTLWRKAADFEPGTNFLAWANRIAHYHVLNYRRKVNRERLIFEDALFEELCARQAERGTLMEGHFEALKSCFQKLLPEQRELLTTRYSPGGSVKRLAELHGKTAGAISQALHRIRESLLNCIHARLQKGDL